MAGILNVVYSLVVLALALVGIAYVFTQFGPEGESRWSQWGEFVAVAVFLVAMVATLLVP